MKDDETKQLIFEISKLIVYAAASLLQLTNATKEEKEQLFMGALNEFEKRDPDKLPDM